MPISITLKEVIGSENLLQPNYNLYPDLESQLTTLNDIPLDFLAIGDREEEDTFVSPVSNLLITDCAFLSNSIIFAWDVSQNADYYEITIQDIDAGTPAVVVISDLDADEFSYAVPAIAPFVTDPFAPLNIRVTVQAFRTVDSVLLSSVVVTAEASSAQPSPNPPQGVVASTTGELTPLLIGGVYEERTFTLNWVAPIPVTGAKVWRYEIQFVNTIPGFGFGDELFAISYADANTFTNVRIDDRPCNTEITNTARAKFRIRARAENGNASSWVEVFAHPEGACIS